MSNRCKLQKEYYKEFGNYKVYGQYTDHYVNWLESRILALTIPVVIVPKGTLCNRCETEKEDAKDEMCDNCWSIYRNAY
jgi:hypothetical protein